MISIQPITARDLPATCELIGRTIRTSWAGFRGPRSLEAFCQKYTPAILADQMKTTTFFIASERADEMSRRILGIIGLKENQLRTFFVDPECQGRGIGRLLYEELEATARERGLPELWLEGSSTGEPVYKSFGFTVERYIEKKRAGESYTDALMRKQLLPLP